MLIGGQAGVARFRRQGYGAVQQRGHLAQGAIGGLQHADAVGDVLGGLGEGRDVGLQAVRNRQAGGIIRAGVDLGA